MRVVISIEDQENGRVAVKTMAHPVIVDQAAESTPATQLADFLLKAIEMWQDTRDMDLPAAQRFLQSVVKPVNTKH